MCKHHLKMNIFLLSRIKKKYIIVGIGLILAIQYFGGFTHMFEADFYTEFRYPLDGDIQKLILQLRNKEVPDIAPVNVYNYTFISSCSNKCEKSGNSGKLRLVYLIKSAFNNFARRSAIRNSWGFERRFSDVPIRTVFLLGTDPKNWDLQNKIDQEKIKYGDIVQADFVDNYYNNTIKTMMGFKWAITYCNHSRFYMFSDDDMYISTKNVLRFVRNPTQYPEYLETPILALSNRKGKKNPYQQNSQSITFTRTLKQFLDFELPEEAKLLAGYVIISAPHRHRNSKWYVSLEEYPYHMWPPYVTAGAYILSHEALVDMYYASLYTKHFLFDDIYLGIVAKKADIEPFHCNEFHFYKKEYNVFTYRHVIASHGYNDPNELLKVWNEQRSAGNA